MKRKTPSGKLKLSRIRIATLGKAQPDQLRGTLVSCTNIVCTVTSKVYVCSYE
ncbi:hypothetical protein [Chitinophaga solisilvae]|uniref:hypothetical protein n=1 Tax=Chitinophaga solisilvae TaxID=1233460 RepID=UPI00136FBFD7|nr:hypothetical protein [Chitinophaga solisilvae]